MRAGKIEVYKDVNREWRWRLISANGRIVADSAEGYKRKASVMRAIERVKKLMNISRIVEVG